MAEMFWLPERSIWLAIIMMWRRPDHTTSNTLRYGMAASRTSSAAAVAIGGAPTIKAASPSVRTRSGAKVSLASRAPSEGMVPNGLAITSPASRQASAQAMTQNSARVTPASLTGPGAP